MDEAREDADIDATAGWAMHGDASAVIMAIIDSGAQLDHVDLKDNLWVNQERSREWHRRRQ